MTTAPTIRRGARSDALPASPASATRMSVVVLATGEILRRSLSRILARVPFDVYVTRSPEECYAVALDEHPALVVVECRGWAALPGFLAKLRDGLRTPVLLAGPDASQGLDALREGLSIDYVRSPVWEHELRARAVRSATSQSAVGIRRFGDLEIESAARSVRLAGATVELSPREFDLLEFLAVHAGSSFSRQDLLEHVWKSSIEWQRPATVTEHVHRLRRKLEENPAHPRWLVTVPRCGYRFETKPAIGPPAARRESAE